MTRFEKQIRDYMDAAFPILYIHTSEEEKAKRAILQAVAEIKRINIFVWDGTDRVCDLRSGEIKYEMDWITLEEILTERMYDTTQRQILIFENIDTFMGESTTSAQLMSIIPRLKKFAEWIHMGKVNATIFILSPILRILPELEKYITVAEMGYLTEDEIENMICEFCTLQGIKISETLKREFTNALKGLSEFEIEHILQLAYSGSGELKKDHISLIHKQKQQLIRKSGILEMVPLKESLADIGGLENLKEWLTRKAKIFSHMEQAKQYGVDLPKGVLIAGIPGCGKSLSAKAVAKLFNVPLLRLDMGRLLGKFVGESEANLRKAIQLADALSPCVLWIDELEKAFAGIGGDGSGAEVTTRLLGSFLTWLQEKDSAAFVVATANDITKLPSELMRKGRFDEIFYVGLPHTEERRKIFEIHIRRRRPKDLEDSEKEHQPMQKSKIDLQLLAEKTNGYSGADIEGVVKASVEMAFDQNKECLTTEEILQAIEDTRSLSEIMEDKIQQLMDIFEKKSFKNASSKEGKKV